MADFLDPIASIEIERGAGQFSAIFPAHFSLQSFFGLRFETLTVTPQKLLFKRMIFGKTWKIQTFEPASITNLRYGYIGFGETSIFGLRFEIFWKELQILTRNESS